MKTVTVYAAKTHLSRLLSEVEKGEEVVIERRGQPVARLVPASPPKPRELGFMRGQFTVAADFDAPLSDAILDEFER